MNKRARFTAESAQATLTSLRGLMAPLEMEEAQPADTQVVEVELGRIRPNPDQPRRSSSPGLKQSSLEELAENIREHGLLQPILVKDTGRFYQIIAGERRFRACQLLGMERVPVRVVEPRDDQDELR
ncbi:MAG: ParB N-terminal domain-containing protein, partial [Chloroflexota bacterium]|nr:ParB N-terminal domain-containing protein [Chloroflexota bacterium]